MEIKKYVILNDRVEMRAVNARYYREDFEEDYADRDVDGQVDQMFDNFEEAMVEYKKQANAIGTPYRQQANVGEVIFYDVVSLEEWTWHDVEEDCIDQSNIDEIFSIAQTVSEDEPVEHFASNDIKEAK